MFNNLEENTDRLLGLLLMRYQISPTESLRLIQAWLESHPQDSVGSLEAALRHELIILENQVFRDLYPVEIIRLVNELRGKNGIEIKDRRYHLKVYPACFIGSEAVSWLVNTRGITKGEALNLGQQLIDYKIIHHVVDQHNFADDYFFYRFYIDE